VTCLDGHGDLVLLKVMDEFLGVLEVRLSGKLVSLVTVHNTFRIAHLGTGAHLGQSGDMGRG